jgi:hypothetical protein
MSFLRTNYRVIGNKANLEGLGSMAESGDWYVSATGSRLIVFYNNPLSASAGTYVALAFSAAAILSVGDI